MTSGPLATRAAERITTLDAVRGMAVLGILTMNAVAFGLPAAAYANLDAAGSRTWLDWLVGGAGEIFADQKFMGLFSMLFGAGVVLFAERAAAKGRRSVLLSLWRNALLLGIGIVHLSFWDGDVLFAYALCAPVVLALRHLPPKVLLALGGGCYVAVAVISWFVQSSLRSFSSVLIDFWHYGDYYGVIGTWFLADYFGRALGAMLIGAALYRTGVISGNRAPSFYRRMAAWGLGVGLPLSAAGFALMAATGFDIDWAVAGTIPNTLATMPLCLGYLSLIALWNAARDRGLRQRICAAGRMALTNYLTQTALGLLVLGALLDDLELGRGGIAVFVVAVWAVQLWWSKAWLDRFAFGPVEWLWRCATYRRWQPIRAR
ncbi:MAG: DUF418 domain-containing protein [Acidimicrobiales bacterium]|nr:DUF418 domain-containing protein [Acidimicrobiaceae bacterium]MXV86543.1 DUF418 domain-containing protein [Acidimicrobiales bacterium]MCY3607185.1 DUF418 domain-containing protein [Acidimicrobiaceae bacterium]MXX44315.1 DUF418 domain-containing protein [Acidimicrobiales bacterium]MXY03364.1 DUF418 domain-containing protein [Acidimicrobiales bacterium]